METSKVSSWLFPRSCPWVAQLRQEPLREAPLGAPWNSWPAKEHCIAMNETGDQERPSEEPRRLDKGAAKHPRSLNQYGLVGAGWVKHQEVYV